MQLLAQAATAPDTPTVFWLNLLVLAWLAFSAVLAVWWAIRTQAGWTPLKGRPPRDNLLQLPVVLIFLGAMQLLPVVVLIVLRPVIALGLLDYQLLLLAQFVGQVLWIFAGIWLIRTSFLRGTDGVGLSGRPVARDILVGAGVMFIIMPLLFVVQVVSNHLWPIERHQLLVLLVEDPQLLTILLAGATALVGAPLGEEVLFRGVLQSYLVRFFRQMIPPKGRPSQTLSVQPPEVTQWQQRQAQAIVEARAADPGTEQDVFPSAPDGEPLTGNQEAGRAVAAIVLGSAVFAAAHFQVPTSMPTIFVLSLALGYVYETSGSLIRVMAMHLVFNAFSFFGTLISHREQLFGG